MESTANINNSNASGIFNEITIKIRYKSNGTFITENLVLYKVNNLENAFNEFKRKKNIFEINNEEEEKVFYLIKETQQIKLDKNKAIEELNLNEGDLIEVSYQPPIIINNNYRHNIINSNSNLNPTLSENKKKNCFIIFLIIGVAVISIIISLLCVFLIKKKKDKTIKDKPSDNINDEEIENNDEEEDNKSNDNLLNMTGKEFPPESLITNKKLYDNMNTLFVYKSNKIINLELETELMNTNDEKNYSNYSTIIQNIDFGFLINEKHQEKDESRRLLKNYYTGYLFLLNITINNGTHDIPLLYNKELYESINDFNHEQYNEYDYDSVDSTNEINNFRRLEKEEEDNQTFTNENRTSFIKIDFYENGEIKNIFTPNDFYEPSMTFFEDIIHLIIPKLSTDLYSDNITEEIDRVNNLLNKEDVEEEELSVDSTDIYEQIEDKETSDDLLIEDSENELDNIKRNMRRRISENEENEDIINITNTYDIS